MNLLDINFADTFAFTVSPLELMLRDTLLYSFLFIVLHFVLRRDVGQLAVSDLMFIVILGDAAQNSMIGIGTSAIDGMFLISTLVFWSHMLDYTSYRFPLVQRFTSAPHLCLVRDGKMLRRNMCREFITDEELNAKIHHQGVEDIADVKCIYLESDGEMGVIRNDESSAGRYLLRDEPTFRKATFPRCESLQWADGAAGAKFERSRVPSRQQHDLPAGVLRLLEHLAAQHGFRKGPGVRADDHGSDTH